ncbi:MAG: hypothetical protein O8C58_05365 [Candidatus Methanoperedens sp.]|nr:hypothetical protein [Candidatus Methanoperedens sp.]
MDKEKKIILILLAALVIGMFIEVSLTQKVSWELKGVSSDIKDLETSIKGVDTSVKNVDSLVKIMKTNLEESARESFKRDMQENGRRMLSLDYAGKFSRWDAAKKEVDELDKNLQDSADHNSDLEQSIQTFRSTYVPKLRDAVDKKDIKNFELVWNETYNSCIACHKGASAPSTAFDVLREISSEVDQLSG